MLNNVVLIGRLTADPERKETASGTPYCQFTLAVDRPTKAEGEKSNADFIDCVAWRDQAESLVKYKGKGDPLAVVGSLETGSYDDSQGIRRRYARVVCRQVKFLPGGKRDGYNGAELPPPEEPGWGKGELDIDLSGDDIQF